MSIPDRIELEPAIARSIQRHAALNAPDESCGLLGGHRFAHHLELTTWTPASNIARHPRLEFRIAPLDFLAVERRYREAGIEVVAVFHSHPGGRARPSRFDARSAWPGMAQLISAPTADVGDLTAWWPVDGRLVPLDVRYRRRPLASRTTAKIPTEPNAAHNGSMDQR